MPYYVYILSNTTGTALRIGVAYDLKRAVEAERDNHPGAETSPSKSLVYYQPYDDEERARATAANLRTMSWLHQTQFINYDNPEWLDLYYDL